MISQTSRSSLISFTHAPPQGQCGYGTSLETIAQQRRQEWAIGASAAGFPTSAQTAMAGPGKEVSKATGGGGGATSWQELQAPQTSSSSGWQSWLQPIEQHTSRQEEAEEAKRCAIQIVTTVIELSSVCSTGSSAFGRCNRILSQRRIVYCGYK